MYKKVKIFVIIVMTSILMSGCASLNPFSSPVKQTDTSSISEPSSAAANPETKKIKENKKEAKKNAENISDNISSKTEDIYYKAMDNYTSNTDNQDNDGNFFENSLSEFYNTYVKIRLAAVWIVLVSIALGILGAIFSSQNKGLRRFFIKVFIFIVPLLMVFIVFGVGLLNSLFLYKN